MLAVDRSVGDLVSDRPTIAFVLAVCSLATLSVGSLSCFHTLLAATNETTNESIKNKFRGDIPNPFDRGSPSKNYFGSTPLLDGGTTDHFHRFFAWT